MYTARITIHVADGILDGIRPTRHSDEARYIDEIIATVRVCFEGACEWNGHSAREIDPEVAVCRYSDSSEDVSTGQFMTIVVETDDLFRATAGEGMAIASDIYERVRMATSREYLDPKITRGPLDLDPHIVIKPLTPALASA